MALKLSFLFFIGLIVLANCKDEVLFWDDFNEDTYTPGTPNQPYLTFDFGDGWYPLDGSVFQEKAGGAEGEESFISISEVPYYRSYGKSVAGFWDNVHFFTFFGSDNAGSPFVRSDGGPVTYNCLLTGIQYNMDQHPYGNAVSKPFDDIRLGHFMINAVDLNTGLISNFMFTNEGVWLYYEVLPGFGENYIAFSQTKRIADRNAGDIHNIDHTYHKNENEIIWYLDGKEVERITNLGSPQTGNGWNTIFEAGSGEYKDIDADGLVYGFGLLSLLNQGRPQDGANSCLANTTAQNSFDFPSTCVYSNPDTEERIFGQGVEMQVFRVAVYEGYGSAGVLIPSIIALMVAALFQ